MNSSTKVCTIRDVAKQAGVSVTTVSRVLNARPDVNPKTREKVMQVIEECHFYCNANAKGLKQSGRDMVAVIIRGRSNSFLNELAEGILRYGEDVPGTLVLEYIDEKADEFQTAVRLYNEMRAVAFIMIGSRPDERASVIRMLDAPFVFVTVNANELGIARVSSVSIDDRLMGQKAAEYLLNKGHRKIAIFGGSRDRGDSLAMRYLGVLDGFRARGLEFDERRYIETRFSMHGGYDSARRHFEQMPDTTAVFAMSDLVAFGVIRALKDIKKRVPEDVSVFGFDGSDLGRFSIPSLTTVQQPVENLCRTTIDVLKRLMAGGDGGEQVVLEAGVIEGESVGSINRA